MQLLGIHQLLQVLIPKYAQVSQPLHVLTSGENSIKKKRLVDWIPECQTALDSHKRLCNSAQILAYADCGKSFQLHTDVSTSEMGAVLYQRQNNGTDCVITYASHILCTAERKYDTHKLEFLALKCSISE